MLIDVFSKRMVLLMVNVDVMGVEKVSLLVPSKSGYRQLYIAVWLSLLCIQDGYSGSVWTVFAQCILLGYGLC